MEDPNKDAIGKAFLAMQEDYEQKLDDLRGQLQMEVWARKAAERELEDPEIQRRLRVFEQVALKHTELTMDQVAKQAELILSESSKFSVRKEEK